MTQSTYSTGALARRYNLPPWKLRRILDQIGPDLPRNGLYRVVPHSFLRRLEKELRKRGHTIPAEQTND